MAELRIWIWSFSTATAHFCSLHQSCPVVMLTSNTLCLLFSVLLFCFPLEYSLSLILLFCRFISHYITMGLLNLLRKLKKVSSVLFFSCNTCDLTVPFSFFLVDSLTKRLVCWFSVSITLERPLSWRSCLMKISLKLCQPKASTSSPWCTMASSSMCGILEDRSLFVHTGETTTTRPMLW